MGGIVAKLSLNSYGYSSSCSSSVWLPNGISVFLAIWGKAGVNVGLNYNLAAITRQYPQETNHIQILKEYWIFLCITEPFLFT